MRQVHLQKNTWPLQIEAQYPGKTVIVQGSAALKLMWTICFCKCFQIFVLYCDYACHLSVFSVDWLWHFIVTIVVFKQEVVCSAHGKEAVLEKEVFFFSVAMFLQEDVVIIFQRIYLALMFMYKSMVIWIWFLVHS